MPAGATTGQIIVTIKPLHSLVAAVMEGSGDMPVLLVDGKDSPHTFHLRPSQMDVLQHADIVFYMGDGFELFMGKVFETLPPSVKRAPMDNVPGLTLYPTRFNDGDEGPTDMHLWMSIANAKRMVAEITRRLSEIAPVNQTYYETNAKKLAAKLDALDAELKTRTKPLKDKPFVVFHDAYQYFEAAYGLQTAGAVTLHPEQGVSAKHVLEIRTKIKSAAAACVFREPSFNARVVDNVLDGTSAKSGVLDPEGALLAPGPELYFQLMRGIADGLSRCLIP